MATHEPAAAAIPAPGDEDDESLPWPDRRAGILLHPTSLPGEYGVGDLGPAAHDFVRLLQSAGQSLWQIMPLGPPGPGHSPYAARSSFAGNPLLISPQALVDEGLLDAASLEPHPPFPAERVDFDKAGSWKHEVFARAFDRFEELRAGELDDFVAQHEAWLPDYALYMALREEQRGSSWCDWPGGLARRDPAALEQARERLGASIRRHEFLQWCFSRQWRALKEHANGAGISIIGDIPIFLDYDSADVWAQQDLFKLDDASKPQVVAGVPPDAFSATGQRWGNPHYRWDVLGKAGYHWWVERLRATFELVDILRLDHFRGFEAAWEIPAGQPTAEHGHWVAGPGRELFDRAEEVMGPLRIVVEDLGIITRNVRALRDTLGYPGMKVLQFAFGDDARNPYLPHNYTPACVVYTGTHDNDTTVGWFQSRSPEERHRILSYLAVDGSDIASDLIRVAYSSVAAMAIVPMQDVLRLGSEARMNTPGQAEGNWAWRFRWDQVDAARMEWLRDVALRYARVRPPA
jgi:4-alpha-glucanotransferase